ncbi:putative cyclic nucleotide-gated ion channel 6 [Raphanus sativus]|uniref:Probable cyclic nucleotide-gated ion channel 6 n=1 Tax=Raphanus sativus TaxID=3726 RepID=A0A9W3DLY9_RAPSA|nr:probable cyclic nucleotide-gated ion channel 6 [Raphanus sativus]KAJ4902870.1 putative cyclic nucleotide-gated ion channel 6 [Raphanus sativus]
MFDCGTTNGVKSQVISGHREKFIRLESMDSRYSSSQSSDNNTGLNKCTLNIQGGGPKRFAQGSKTSSGSFKKGFRKGSEGLWSIGRSIGLGVSRAVFPEDLKVSEKKIFDPQDKFLLLCNKLFVASCILAVSVDPLFLYLPFINDKAKCIGIDRKLAIVATTLRTVIDSFYLFHMALRFRTAYVAPSSRVFGRGELVIDPAQIAKRYLQQYFIVDLLSVLPVPQIIVWRFLYTSRGANVLATKQALRYIVLVQYIPRFLRMYPLSSELKRTAGVFAETAWAGAAYYLLLYMLASHIVGALWYLLALERNNDCWIKACHSREDSNCTRNFLFCGNQNMEGYAAWDTVKYSILQEKCPVNVTDGEEPPFDFGIYSRALSSGIVSSKKFVSKYFFCLWWGLQNLSTLGQGLETSTYPGEVIFSIALAIAGLLLFALLIGNMQTYLQSLTIRLEEMRVKRRDSEQWMHHRMLPPELRERVRRYDQYKWLETRGVDEENIVSNLPKDLRRDIKRHLCLALVRRVPLFDNMDERLLDAICMRLKPCLYTDKSFLVREGDPVNEMLFIIRGRLESVTTDGGRSGFYNRSLLKEGDFCGDELLTWALDPKSGSNLPSSTRTVKALTEVEAFALIADELKFVASQFRRLHSRQVQHTFRFYSQQWRTWAACFIQAAWRRYTKRKKLEQLRKEEEEEEEESAARLIAGGSPYSIRATFLASKFAANALRSVHKNRTKKLNLAPPSTKELVKFQKPPEPDFSADC